MRYVEYPQLTVTEIKTLFDAVGWVRENRDWERQLDSIVYGSSYVAAAYDNDNFVGMVCAVDDGLHAVVINFAILPEYQSRGVGSTLLGMLKERYNDFIILLSTSKARKFYEKHGFNRVGDGMRDVN